MRHPPYLRLAIIALACAFIAGCQQYWRESGVWDIGDASGPAV